VTQTADDLKGLLERIFEDSIVEPKEREALAECTKSIKAEETLSVFKAFLKAKWGEAMADDVLTGPERSLLTKIMTELDLELSDLPPQARLALTD